MRDRWPASASAVGYGQRTILIPDLLDFLGYSIQSLIPGYALPFAFATFPGPFHRVFEAVGVVYELGGSKPLRA